MGEHSCYSQFPYPLQNEVIFKECQLKCGKMNIKKTKYLVLSRNCLYYYPSTPAESKECFLSAGIIPLVGLQFPQKRVVYSEKCEVIVKSAVNNIAYIKMKNAMQVEKREKREFCFVFGKYRVHLLFLYYK